MQRGGCPLAVPLKPIKDSSGTALAPRLGCGVRHGEIQLAAQNGFESTRLTSNFARKISSHDLA